MDQLAPTKLEFDSAYYFDIYNRNKRSTVRAGSRIREYVPGDKVALCVNGNFVRTGIVDLVKVKQLHDVSQHDLKDECLKSGNIYDELAEVYHRYFKAEDIVTIIRWRYVE